MHFRCWTHLRVIEALTHIEEAAKEVDLPNYYWYVENKNNDTKKKNALVRQNLAIGEFEFENVTDLTYLGTNLPYDGIVNNYYYSFLFLM